MAAAKDAPDLLVHKEWLGQIQQVGLVVSPYVLQKNAVGINREDSLRTQTALRALASDTDDARVNTFHELATQVLQWPSALLAGAPDGPELPGALTVALPEYDDRLSPSYGLRAPEGGGYLALVTLAPTGADLDKPLPDQHDGWRASPHARLERLLRESGVSIGLLFSHTHLRLVYAPRGESSGHLTFRFKHLLETLGRPMAGALYALLGERRVTDALPDAERLLALLQESRKYQNVVSTRLAEQVLEALWHLLRGFQRANDATSGTLLAEALRENPQEVYGGLLSTLMRLVFILYAEDRGLMPGSDVYQKHYAVSGLFERLREDAARYPDTMDDRYGAWAQLLALFRLIHDGGGHGDLHFPPRHGRLFDPDAYPFLEGRPHGSTRVIGALVEPPRVPDGVVFRVLQNLMVLDGERLSYRALDVEQIGSVYEAMMGFALQQAAGPSVAVKPKHIVVNLADLLEQAPKERAAWLTKTTELKLAGDALGKATTAEELLAALGNKVSKPYTPAPLPAGAMFLQPTEERRRSGSHYTPRSLTQPIVATTFRPIFERLGDQATPDQILDLKVCDPAMGSGAFLVEACRLLAERLVRAWEVHKVTPKVPDDEDVLTYARRLVAERCLYGVDKNVFAVDLAKLSLWLATLAKEHPFTFLDHSLRQGDSLVGLTREQIVCFNWNVGKQLPLIRGLIDERLQQAQRLREQIQGMGSSDDVPTKARLLSEANEVLEAVRRIGDLAVSAFFASATAKERQTRLASYIATAESWLRQDRPSGSQWPQEQEVTGFHWELEFPEVFQRPSPGFDAFVGNPPFLGGVRISEVYGGAYRDWLALGSDESTGRADLAAHFFLRCFLRLNPTGCLGLIATNTICQGDTRRTGLKRITEKKGEIYSAVRALKWPGVAAVVVSVVHVSRRETNTAKTIDGEPVPLITSFLLRAGNDSDPETLHSNLGIAFQGVIVLGMGFTFDDQDRGGDATSLAEMAQILEADPRSQSLVKPYLGGQEVNEDPRHRHRRYVIDFDEMSEQEAREFPLLWRLAERKVRPGRVEKDGRKYPRMVHEWWKFWNPRHELRSKLAALREAIVISRVSDTFAFAIVPAETVFADSLNVFASESMALFAILQSAVHEAWVRMFSSSLKGDLRYSPTDCFETFPLPERYDQIAALHAAGSSYRSSRAAVLLQRNYGLTALYGEMADGDCTADGIVTLRELHRSLTDVVCDAYGWSDLKALISRNTDARDLGGAARDEVIGRLIKLNADRAVLQGTRKERAAADLADPSRLPGF